MLHRRRKCVGDMNDTKLDGTVQIDEIFWDGKNTNRHWDKKVENSQGRSFKDKTPVFDMLQQDRMVVVKVVEDTKAKTLRKEINKTIQAGSTIFSDEWNYGNLNRKYNHSYVEHKQKQYVSGEVTTNGIESFWATLKRRIIGIYHHVSHNTCKGICARVHFGIIPIT
ncbi:MAG: IS1595 family transposase [Lentimicrobiaceae bacterium]|nr:IS1595 family transposase [Lentimicrobiaceae bacterium]